MASCQTANPDMEVSRDVLRELLVLARGHLYKPFNPHKADKEIFSLCHNLFTKDYECHLITNFGVELQTHYPKCLIVPLKDKNNPEIPSLGGNLPESDEEKLKKTFRKRFMRTQFVRQYGRVAVPTILFNGKFICRSASIYENVLHACTENKVKEPFEKSEFEYQMNLDTAVFIFLNLTFAKGVRKDVKLLKCLGVHYICDLRISNKFHGMPNYPDIVLSSKDAFTDMYKEFTTVHMPYPGVEFFKKYHANPKPEELRYKWNTVQGQYNVELPDIDHKTLFDKDIETFNTKWNLLDYTQNYLLVLLMYITSGKGILVHCLMGLDRTPVFITLVRLSLWADGLIHQSLSPIEVLYLSAAYDWYLFGHDLPLCLEKKFQIMHFCFNFLKEISGSKFSMRKSDEETIEESTSSSAPAETNREKKLKAVRKLFLDVYLFSTSAS